MISNKKLILKKYKIKNFIFYKINKIQLTLNRVQLDKKTYISVINQYDIKNIIRIEKTIRENLPETCILKSNLINNTIKTSLYRSKNILQTNIINDDLTNKDEKWASIDIFIDNLYSFENNPKLVFYKIKLKTIEYLD